jgi:hypothetical protein
VIIRVLLMFAHSPTVVEPGHQMAFVALLERYTCHSLVSFPFLFLRSLYLAAAVFGVSASIYPLLSALGYHPYLGVIVESGQLPGRVRA